LFFYNGILKSTGSGGGSGFPNPADADLNMNTFDVINICATKFDNADGTELNSTDYGMEVYGYDLRYNIWGGASTNDNAHAFRVDNTTKLEIYEERTKVWNSIWMAAYPNNIIKSSTANEMGYQVTNDSITAGSEGTMQIPYKESTAGQSVGSNATLDGWFGNADGCTGIQYDSSVSAGSGRYRHWLRLNGGWYKSEAY